MLRRAIWDRPETVGGMLKMTTLGKSKGSRERLAGAFAPGDVTPRA